jgi:hypothetical protein
MIFSTSFGFWATQQGGRIDLYQFDPELRLLADLNSTDEKLNHQAFTQLQWRYRNGSLSKTARDRFLATCLGRQMDNPRDKMVQRIMSFLFSLYESHELTPKELDRFIRQTVSAFVEARPKVLVNEEVPVTFRVQLCALHTGYSERVWVKIVEGSDFLDNKLLRKEGINVIVTGRWGCGRRIGVPSPAPGKHRVTCDAVAEVYFGIPERKEESRLLFKTTIRDEADFAVLEREPPDYITLRTDRATESTLRASIRLKNFEFVNFVRRQDGYQQCPGIEGVVIAENPPICFAFDILARIEGREYYIDSVYKSETESSYSSGSAPRNAVCYDGPIVGEITVVLSPNKALAKQTTSIFEIWGGELVYEHVPISLPPELKR